MAKTKTDILDDIRIQMWEYVNLRERLGDPITYQHALRSHRDQIAANLRDEPTGPWRERLAWLDELCAEEGL